MRVRCLYPYGSKTVNIPNTSSELCQKYRPRKKKIMQHLNIYMYIKRLSNMLAYGLYISLIVLLMTRLWMLCRAIPFRIRLQKKLKFQLKLRCRWFSKSGPDPLFWWNFSRTESNLHFYSHDHNSLLSPSNIRSVYQNLCWWANTRVERTLGATDITIIICVYYHINFNPFTPQFL